MYLREFYHDCNLIFADIHVKRIECILNDPFIVIESFEFGSHPEDSLCPGHCQDYEMSSFLHSLVFFLESSVCRNLKLRAAAMLVSQKPLY